MLGWAAPEARTTSAPPAAPLGTEAPSELEQWTLDTVTSSPHRPWMPLSHPSDCVTASHNPLPRGRTPAPTGKPFWILPHSMASDHCSCFIQRLHIIMSSLGTGTPGCTKLRRHRGALWKLKVGGFPVPSKSINAFFQQR